MPTPWPYPLPVNEKFAGISTALATDGVSENESEAMSPIDIRWKFLIYYLSTFVEVIKPAPHAKCIVGIMASSERNSRGDFPIKIDEITRNIP